MKRSSAARKSKASKERRKFSRFKSFNLLQVMDARTSVPFEKDITLVNISEGGLQFYSGEAVQVNDRIRLKIDIREFHSTVNCFGRVIWSQKSTEHVGTHFTGVEFVDIQETDRDVLRRLEHASPVARRRG